MKKLVHLKWRDFSDFLLPLYSEVKLNLVSLNLLHSLALVLHKHLRVKGMACPMILLLTIRGILEIQKMSQEKG